MSSIRCLQTATTLNTGILTGVALSLSSIGVSLALESPTTFTVLRQWSFLLRSSRLLFSAAVPVLVGLPYAFLAFTFRPAASTSTKAMLYLLSAALCLGPVPYGRLFMRETEEKLEGKAAAGLSVGAEAAELKLKREETAKYLVDHWGVLNLGRVAMVLGAGLAGLGASVVGR
ncbi:hypothetical protein GE09DRAFT_1128591 [Coniochaeta sp. 2T2.1]|nr:hypothetical protein GE09DRAFT_1128591 [Coniochaeta sp. 2T2.1]